MNHALAVVFALFVSTPLALAQAQNEYQDLRQLQEVNQKRQRTVQSLNDQYLQGQSPENQEPALSPAMLEFLKKHQDKIRRLQASPHFQKIQRRLAQPRVQAPLRRIAKKADWVKLGLMQLGLFVIYLVFRAHMKAQKENWLGRLWTGTWCFALYTALSLTLVPRVALGPDYFEFVQALINPYMT